MTNMIVDFLLKWAGHWVLLLLPIGLILGAIVCWLLSRKQTVQIFTSIFAPSITAGTGEDAGWTRPPGGEIPCREGRAPDFRTDCLIAGSPFLPYEDFLNRWRDQLPPLRRLPSPAQPYCETGNEPPPESVVYRVGQWVRVTIQDVEYGALGELTSTRLRDLSNPSKTVWRVKMLDGHAVDLEEGRFRLALPKTGESWLWVGCSKHNRMGSGDMPIPTRVPPPQDPSRSMSRERAAVECGCLRPVGFFEEIRGRAE